MVPPRARYRTRWANWFIRAWLCRIRFLNIRCQIKSRSSSAQVGDTYESGQVSSRVEANQFFILKQLQLLFVRQITTLTETTQHNCRELDSSSPFSWQIEFAQPVSLANLVRLPVLSKYQRANSFPSLPNQTKPRRGNLFPSVEWIWVDNKNRRENYTRLAANCSHVNYEFKLCWTVQHNFDSNSTNALVSGIAQLVAAYSLGQATTLKTILKFCITNFHMIK